MTTYRECREARAARLREWAEKREADVAAVRKADEVYTSDNAFNTQPGPIPVRARVIARADRAYQSHLKAESMSSKADNIEAAAERAIYSDDHDAAARLDERIAELEAERERIKAFNASCRAGTPAIAMLTEDEHREWVVVRWLYPKLVGFPSYKLTNLSSNINRLKKRRAALEEPA